MGPCNHWRTNTLVDMLCWAMHLCHLSFILESGNREHIQTNCILDARLRARSCAPISTLMCVIVFGHRLALQWVGPLGSAATWKNVQRRVKCKKIKTVVRDPSLVIGILVQKQTDQGVQNRSRLPTRECGGSPRLSKSLRVCRTDIRKYVA